MPRFNVGDTVLLKGRNGKVVWLRENANEIEAIDEYIVEFADHHREFVVSSELESLDAKQPPAADERNHERDHCHPET